MPSEISKTKIDTKYVSLIFCLLIVYVIPISSTLSLSSGEHGTIFYYLRLGILPLAFACIIVDGITKITDIVEYFVLIILIIISYFVHNEIPTTSIIIFMSLLLFDKVNKTDRVVSNRTIHNILVLHLIQIALMSFMYFLKYRIPGVLSSGKDPNYTGYFLIILYYMLGSETDERKIQPRDILLLLSIFTYSRTALFATALIFIMRFIRFNNSKFATVLVRNPLFVFVIGEVLWLLICKVFIVFWGNFEYVYQFRQGIDRFRTIADGSNYMRAAMNVFLVEDFNIKSFFIGYTAEEYNNAVLSIISRVNNPHNAFLAIYLQSGAIYGIAVIRRITALFKNIGALSSMFLIYILYALILGPSTYYGIESILILIAVMIQKSKIGDHENA